MPHGVRLKVIQINSHFLLIIQASPGWVKEEDNIAIESAMRQRQNLMDTRISDTLIDERNLPFRNLIHIVAVVLCELNPSVV